MDKIWFPFDSIQDSIENCFDLKIFTQIEDSTFEYTEQVAGYKIDFMLSKSHKYILFDIAKTKEYAGYLAKNGHPPKDCDVVLVDITEKVVYLFEIKKSYCRGSLKQINSGKKWLEHLVFCTRIESMDEVSVVKCTVIAEVAKQKNIWLRYEKIDKDGFIISRGKRVIVNQVKATFMREAV